MVECISNQGRDGLGVIKTSNTFASARLIKQNDNLNERNVNATGNHNSTAVENGNYRAQALGDENRGTNMRWLGLLGLLGLTGLGIEAEKKLNFLELKGTVGGMDTLWFEIRQLRSGYCNPLAL